jgi:hypothetical protein
LEKAIPDPVAREAALKPLREEALRKLKTIQDWTLEREFRQVVKFTRQHISKSLACNCD